MGIEYIEFFPGLPFPADKLPEEIITEALKEKQKKKREKQIRRGLLAEGNYQFRTDTSTMEILVMDNGQGTIRIGRRSKSTLVDLHENTATITHGAHTYGIGPHGIHSFAITSTRNPQRPIIHALISYQDVPNPTTTNNEILGRRLKRVL